MIRISYVLYAVVVTVPMDTAPVVAAEPDRTPAEWLSYFAEEWDESAWGPANQRRGRPGYMRTLGDGGWQARMLTLQGLVRAGEAAVPVLLDALGSDDVPRRILAAQALSYLAPHADIGRLTDALDNESSTTVRLYLVDAIGMHGEPGQNIEWDSFLEQEPNRDVRKHVGYVREREGRPVDAQIVEELKSWERSRMDTAIVGRPAPDFELTSAQGNSVKLSDFRGEKPVVLVFIYGDT